jgi:5-methylcytosine-specific restriction endonuclease McrA
MSQQKKQIRKKFNDDCLKRDKYKCRVCPREDDLAVHHITDRKEMPNGGYVKENGITLCPDCHLKAERWYLYQDKYEETFPPNNLYFIIASSYEKAVAASNKL